MKALATALVAILAVSGCGSSADIAGSSAGGGKSSPSTSEEMTRADCLTMIGPFADAMQEIDSRLDVGLSEQDFVQKVGTAKVRHDRIDAKALSGACLDAGVSYETALNHYIEAASKWSNCVSSYSCTFKKINGYMQSQWLAASSKIEKAKAAVDKLQ
jgi:hypothetical protein